MSDSVQSSSMSPLISDEKVLSRVTVNLTRLSPSKIRPLSKSLSVTSQQSVNTLSNESSPASVDSESILVADRSPESRDKKASHTEKSDVDGLVVKKTYLPPASSSRSDDDDDRDVHKKRHSIQNPATYVHRSNSVNKHSSVSSAGYKKNEVQSDAGLRSSEVEDKLVTNQLIAPLPISSNFRIPKKRHEVSESWKLSRRRSYRDSHQHETSYSSKQNHPYQKHSNNSSKRHTRPKRSKELDVEYLSSKHQGLSYLSPKTHRYYHHHHKEAGNDKVQSPKLNAPGGYTQRSMTGSMLEVEMWLNDNPVGERPNAAGEVEVKKKKLSPLPKPPPPKPETIINYARNYGKGPNDEPMPMDVEELISGINVFRGHVDCDSDAICGQLTQLRSQMREEAMIIDDDTSSIVQKKLYVVLDTNVLASELYTIDEIMRSRNGENDTLQVVLVVPWMVLQELDRIKNERRERGSKLREMASKAVRYLHDLFTNCHPQIRGQPSYEAIEDVGLEVECNDDRILHCCLLYSTRGNGKLLLFSNDRNLCNKAIVHEIKAHTKETIKEALEKMAPLPPSMHQIVRGNADEAMYSSMLKQVKTTLLGILEAIVKTEMEKVYGDMWLKIILIHPPWICVMDLLKCLEKHWIAVFGHCVKRSAKVYLDLMIQKVKALGRFVSHDNVKSLMIESLQFLSYFEQHSSYEGKLKSAVVTIRGFLNQLKGEAVIPQEKQQQYRTQGKGHTEELSAGRGPPQDDMPSVIDIDEEERPMDPICSVLHTFETVWSSINHICGCLCDSFGLSNPFTYNKPQVLPTPLESFNFLPRFYPVITEIRDLLTSVLRLPREAPPTEEAYMKLCFKLENYFISLNLVSEHKVREDISPELLHFFRSTEEKRELLGRGLIQIEECCAYTFRLILMVKNLNV